MAETVFQLKCSCNEYPWGRKGSESAAARLCAKTPGTDFRIQEDHFYSEMWMGTYPKLPSYVLSTGEDLQKVLERDAERLIGKPVLDTFGESTLPFLPKILSISKALPLQLHPDRGMAEELHRKDPSKFTDPNHKPEIAVALTRFEAFCGFRPLTDIEKTMRLEPLNRFWPPVEKPAFDDQMLKYIVRSMLLASDEVIAETEDKLKALPRDAFGDISYIQDLLPRLEDQYGKTDPGSLVALITMNYMVLKPGECLYVPADGIHAYLSGDIVECMARSDNVLSTGFCPAAERNSVDLFCQCLAFMPHSAEEALVSPRRFERSANGKAKLYAPPLSEFNMIVVELGKEEEEKIEALAGPGIFIVTRGAGTMKIQEKEFELSEGYVFFIGQGNGLMFHAKNDLQIFMPFIE